MSEHPNGNKIEYERSDADLKAVTRIGVGLALLTIVVALALVPILKVMVDRQKESDVAPPPIAGFEPGRRAPEPRLQEEPFRDWTAQKARQESLLRSYGWVDEAAGVTRIPIEQAMTMLAERGLPARAAAPSPVAAPAAPTAPGPAKEGHP